MLVYVNLEETKLQKEIWLMHKISFKAFDDDIGAEMMILGRNCFILLRLSDLYYSVERHDGKLPCDLWNVEEFFTVYRRLQDQSSIPILLTCHLPACVKTRLRMKPIIWR